MAALRTSELKTNAKVDETYRLKMIETLKIQITDEFKEAQALQLREDAVISSNESFVFSELDKKYSNIEIVKICNETYYQANIKSKHGNLIAELFLYNEEKDFRLIKDNFPFPRKGYSFNLPVKTFEQLEYYLSTVSVDLIRT